MGSGWVNFDDVSVRKVSAYDLTYDAENRLTQVKKDSVTIASFTYDGDGARVKAVQGGTTTAFVGNILEWTGSTSTMVKYYGVYPELAKGRGPAQLALSLRRSLP